MSAEKREFIYFDDQLIRRDLITRITRECYYDSQYRINMMLTSGEKITQIWDIETERDAVFDELVLDLANAFTQNSKMAATAVANVSSKNSNAAVDIGSILAFSNKDDIKDNGDILRTEIPKVHTTYL